MAAYLETDKPENVRLYQHFNFEVTSGGTGARSAKLVHVAFPGRQESITDCVYPASQPFYPFYGLENIGCLGIE